MSKPDNPLLFTPEYLKTIETQEEADRIGGVIGGTYMVSGNTNWTLRDLFAGFALTGLVTDMERATSAEKFSNTPSRTVAKAYAEIAGELADAMLAERERDE